MKLKRYDWVFSVVLSVGITSSNLKNEAAAKSDYFCDFYPFLKWWGWERHFIFMKGVPASKKVGNL